VRVRGVADHSDLRRVRNGTHRFWRAQRFARARLSLVSAPGQRVGVGHRVHDRHDHPIHRLPGPAHHRHWLHADDRLHARRRQLRQHPGTQRRRCDASARERQRPLAERRQRRNDQQRILHQRQRQGARVAGRSRRRQLRRRRYPRRRRRRQRRSDLRPDTGSDGPRKRRGQHRPCGWRRGRRACPPPRRRHYHRVGQHPGERRRGRQRRRRRGR